MKQILFVLIGFVLGIFGTILFFSSQGTFTDAIRLLGIFVSATVLIFITTLLNKNQNNSNLLKNHFISEVNNQRENYLVFMKKLQDRQLTKQEVTSGFKTFSEDFNQLEVFLNQEFSISSPVQKQNRDIHLLTCDNLPFDSLKPTDSFALSNELHIQLEKKLKDFKYLLINLILRINKK